MADIKGRVALVTGAARGIGRAIALRYAREGALVVVADILADEAKAVAAELTAAGARAEAVTVDVRDPAQSVAMVAHAVKCFGRLDILVNNAGVIRVRPLLEHTPADWDDIHAVNSRGLFFALQAGARQMMHQPAPATGSRGKIINVASIAGRTGRPLFAAYAASKASAISVTQSAALALAPHINVNAICPGVVDTEMWRQIDREWSQLEGRPVGSAWKERTRNIPLVRPENAEDLVGTAVFLASADSDYVTGQSFNIDGGLVMS